MQAEDLCRLHIGAMAAEMNSFNRSGKETVNTGPYGALPILIFSQDTAKMAERHVGGCGECLEPNAGEFEEALDAQPQNYRQGQFALCSN